MEIKERILELPGLMKDAEINVINKTSEIIACENELTSKENELVIKGVDGKNAQERKANMAETLKPIQEKLQKLKNEKIMLQVEYNYFDNEFKALRSVASMV